MDLVEQCKLPGRQVSHRSAYTFPTRVALKGIEEEGLSRRNDMDEGNRLGKSEIESQGHDKN